MGPGFRLILSVGAVLSWWWSQGTAAAPAQETLGPWHLQWAGAVSPEARSVLAWSEDLFGVSEPSHRRLTLIRADGAKKEPVRQLVLRHDIVGGEGQIYPDPIARHPDGTIYWLSHARETVYLFAENGDPLSSFPTWSEPFSMAVLPNGDVRIAGTSADTRRPVIEDYRRSGFLYRTAPGWMTQTAADKRFRALAGQVFLLLTRSGETVQVASWFPFVKVEGEGRERVFEILCGALPAGTRERYRRFGLVAGQPQFLGPAEEPLGPSRPYVLAASLFREAVVVAVLNGGYLLEVGLSSERAQCWPIPPVCAQSSRGDVYTSVAVVGAHLALLRSDGCVSLWQRAGQGVR